MKVINRKLEEGDMIRQLASSGVLKLFIVEEVESLGLMRSYHLRNIGDGTRLEVDHDDLIKGFSDDVEELMALKKEWEERYAKKIRELTDGLPMDDEDEY